jgi:hypothetical protein
MTKIKLSICNIILKYLKFTSLIQKRWANFDMIILNKVEKMLNEPIDHSHTCGWCKKRFTPELAGDGQFCSCECAHYGLDLEICEQCENPFTPEWDTDR